MSLLRQAHRPLTCCIHQPEHLPYAGFWGKLLLSDVWIAYDSAQYQKSHYHNRNKIAGNGASGWQWLTVPVKVPGLSSPMSEAWISNEFSAKKYIATLVHAYRTAPASSKVLPLLIAAAGRAEKHRRLVEFNMELTESIAMYLGIHFTTVLASSLRTAKTGKTERLIDFCGLVSADTYICGSGASAYMDYDLFANSGIQVKSISHHPMPYARNGDYIPGLSIIDLLMYTPDTADVIQYLISTTQSQSHVGANNSHSV